MASVTAHSVKRAGVLPRSSLRLVRPRGCSALLRTASKTVTATRSSRDAAMSRAISLRVGAVAGCADIRETPPGQGTPSSRHRGTANLSAMHRRGPAATRDLGWSGPHLEPPGQGRGTDAAAASRGSPIRCQARSVPAGLAHHRPLPSRTTSHFQGSETPPVRRTAPRWAQARRDSQVGPKQCTAGLSLARLLRQPGPQSSCCTPAAATSPPGGADLGASARASASSSVLGTTSRTAGGRAS